MVPEPKTPPPPPAPPATSTPISMHPTVVPTPSDSLSSDDASSPVPQLSSPPSSQGGVTHLQPQRNSFTSPSSDSSRRRGTVAQSECPSTPTPFLGIPKVASIPSSPGTFPCEKLVSWSLRPLVIPGSRVNRKVGEKISETLLRANHRVLLIRYWMRLHQHSIMKRTAEKAGSSPQVALSFIANGSPEKGQLPLLEEQLSTDAPGVVKSCVFRACCSLQIEVMETLMTKYPLDWGTCTHGPCELTLLHLAIKASKEPSSALKTALSYVSPEAEDTLGRTPLDVAVLQGSPHVVQVVLEAGCCTPRTLSHAKALASTLATNTAHPDYADIELMLTQEAAASEATQMENRVTRLHMLAMGGVTTPGNASQQLAALFKLLAELRENGKLEEELMAQTTSGKTPLHFAAGGCWVKAVSALIDVASELGLAMDMLTVQDENGNTPLHAASHAGAWEAVSLMMQKMSELGGLGSLSKYLETRDKAGDAAVHIAAARSRTKVINTLLACDCKHQVQLTNAKGLLPVHLAAGSGDPATTWAILERGCPIETTDHGRHRWTPLMHAVDKGGYKVVNLLVESDARLNTTFAENQAAIHLVSERGWDRCLSILIVNNADTSLRTSENQTALHIAAEAGQVECVRLLLAYNLQLADATDSLGNTALHLAAARGFVEVVRLLCTECPNPDVNTPNAWGDTAVHLSACRGSYKCLEILLSHGATLSRGEHGWSAVHCAASTLPEFAQCIVSHLQLDFTLRQPGEIKLTCLEFYDRDNTLIPIQSISGGVFDTGKAVLINSSTPLEVEFTLPSAVASYTLVPDGPLLQWVLKGNRVSRASPGWVTLDTKNTVTLPSSKGGRHTIASQCLRVLASAGANLNETDSCGDPPIVVAGKYNRVEAVYELWRLGADLNAPGKDGLGLVHVACLRQDSELLQGLVHLPIDFEIPDSKGLVPLHHAVTAGAIDVVSVLCSSGKVNINSHPSLYNRSLPYHEEPALDCTPLYLAIVQRKWLMLEVLHKQGASLSFPTEGWKSALHCAVEVGIFHVTQELLSLGASLFDKITPDGGTVVHIACAGGMQNVMANFLKVCPDCLLIEDDEHSTPMHASCSSGNQRMVQFLMVKVKGKVWALRGKDGCTPLMCSTMGGYADVVETLFETNLDGNPRLPEVMGSLEIPNHFDLTPLQVAVTEGYTAVVTVLLKVGANVKVITPLEGRSLLHLAALSGEKSLKILQLLLRHGRDIPHSTSIRIPCFSRLGSTTLSRLLQLSIRSTDIAGHTPLHSACEVDNCLGVRLLQLYRSDCNAPAKNGDTPLIVCVKSGAERCVQMLLKDPSLDVNACNTEGNTALSLAQKDHMGGIEAL
eukprot:Sspe_Gene.33877::Locus_16489_Transcript_1_1_Confidence_1.000_Length_4034::g.33877::m.33877/K10380/ANK; ankyrin